MLSRESAATIRGRYLGGLTLEQGVSSGENDPRNWSAFFLILPRQFRWLTSALGLDYVACCSEKSSPDDLNSELMLWHGIFPRWGWRLGANVLERLIGDSNSIDVRIFGKFQVVSAVESSCMIYWMLSFLKVRFRPNEQGHNSYSFNVNCHPVIWS